MIPPIGSFRNVLRNLPVFVGLTGFLLLAPGCHTQKGVPVDDPALKPIAEMLQSKVPLGAPEAVVHQFLALRGYVVEPGKKPSTVVAIIRHIDPEKLEPVTARVTFYFNAHGKLDSYEISRTVNQPVPQ